MFRRYISGLGNLSVNALAQDQKGFVWVGTESGLYRFDGVNFTEFGRAEGLPGRFILSIAEDITGHLWVGTQDGLAYQSGINRFTSVSFHGHTLRLRPGKSVVAPGWGGVLVACDDGLLEFYLRDGEVVSGTILTASSLHAKADSKAEIHGVLPRRDGSVVFGCGQRICELRGGKVASRGVAEGVPVDDWAEFLERFDGELWARGPHHIVMLAPGALRFQNADLPVTADVPLSTALSEDASGRILAGIYSGLARYEDGKWSTVSDRNGFGEGSVTTILLDRDNQPWFGFDGHGLMNWIGYDAWEHWTKRQGLGSNQMWSMLRDKRGRLWLGHQAGVSILRQESDKIETWSPPGLHPARATSIAETRDGVLFIGTSLGYLIRVDPRTMHATEEKFDRILRVFVDSQDQVWIATKSGLAKSEGHGWGRTFRIVRNEVVTVDDFHDVQQGVDGRLWAVTATSLYCLKSGQWKRVDISAAHLGTKLEDVAVDQSGMVWIDGAEFGAARFKIEGDKVTWFEHLKLASNEVLFLGLDRRGWTWIGEDHGVEVFDGKRTRAFSLDHGLIWNDCDSKAFFQDTDGTVWIGTSGGLSHFLSKRLPTGIPSRPVLTKVTYGETELSGESERVNYQRQPLVFEVAALSFYDRGSIRFRYRLEGLEDSWNETSSSEIRYPKLWPRTYRLEVMAIDGSSGQSSPTTSLDLEIVAPWYLTGWFATLSLVAAAVLAYLIWQWRVRAVLEKSYQLEKLVMERTDELNRQLLEQARLKLEAERANRAKSEFLAMMSHEIRTPMNGVMGMTSMLALTELNDEQQQLVDTITESGSSLLAIINDILDFSKIEAGKLSLEKTDFSLNDLLDEVISIVYEGARRKHLEMLLSASGRLPVWVSGDPVRLKQVLLNLLSNAIKFTERGTIELRVSKQEMSDSRSAHLLFEVQDSGIGIDDEAQSRLFQSFEQAERSTTRRFGGTGLGLAICKRLVELFGGEIGVRSQPGEGSTFWFSVRMGLATDPTESLEATEIPKPLEKTGQRKRILIAEDNIINQKVAMRMLSVLGYQGDIAKDGETALRLVQEGSYDAVLMDMHMPIMDGLEATRAIRQLNSAISRIPIIALTANALQGEKQKCLAAGMDDFIAKPIEKEKFEFALGYWTNQCGLEERQPAIEPSEN